MGQWMSLHATMHFNMAGTLTEKRQNIWKILTLQYIQPRQEEYHPQPVPLSGRLLEHRLPDYRDQVEWAKVDSQTGTKRCEICESIFKIMKWNTYFCDLGSESGSTSNLFHGTSRAKSANRKWPSALLGWLETTWWNRMTPRARNKWQVGSWHTDGQWLSKLKEAKWLGAKHLEASFKLCSKLWSVKLRCIHGTKMIKNYPPSNSVARPWSWS